MKYFAILFVAFFTLLLSGCTQQVDTNKNTIGPAISGDAASNISTEAVQSTPINSPSQDISRGFIASGMVRVGTNLFISGDKLIYSGLFSIKMPEQLTTWESDSTYGNDLAFANEDGTKRLTLFIRQPSNQEASETQLCKKELTEGVISKSEKTKIIQGKNIYITNVVFEVSGPDIQPGTFKETEFCFVHKDQIFNFAISDYSQEYMNSIVDSLHFEE